MGAGSACRALDNAKDISSTLSNSRLGRFFYYLAYNRFPRTTQKPEIHNQIRLLIIQAVQAGQIKRRGAHAATAISTLSNASALAPRLSSLFCSSSRAPTIKYK